MKHLKERKVFWKESMLQEFDNLMSNKTWNIVNNPGNRRIINTKWVLKSNVMKMAI